MGQAALHRDAFENLKFFKTGDQIKTAASKLKAALEAKVKERHARITDIVKQKGLTESELLLAMQEVGHHYAMTSTTNGPSIDAPMSGEPVPTKAILTAGEKQQIQQELHLIRNEENEADKMRLIIDNLDASEKFELSFQDLEYLQF